MALVVRMNARQDATLLDYMSKRAEEYLESHELADDAMRYGIGGDLEMVNAYVIAREICQPMTRSHRAAEILPEPSCVVKPSPVHGRGVFATRDIAAGEYLTMYPADSLVLQPLGWKDGPMQHSYAMIGPLSVDVCNHYAHITRRLDRSQGLDMVSIVGDPQKAYDRHFLGHVVNDAASLSSGASEDDYRTVSRSRQNCMCNVDRACALVAVRRIVADSELFMSYGVPCWRPL